jgi:hypothetical protein
MSTVELTTGSEIGTKIAELFQKKMTGEIDIKQLTTGINELGAMSSEDVDLLVRKCVSSSAGALFALLPRDLTAQEFHELLNHDKKYKFVKYFTEKMLPVYRGETK